MTDGLRAWEERSEAEWVRHLEVRTVELHASIDSTNRRGREIAAQPDRLPAVIVADRQTRGRGRMGRTWHSNTPDGLWLSIVLGDSAGTPIVSLLAGLAVARSIDALGGRAGVKWPNDVFLAGRKVAGILSAQVPGGVVVGIGVNVNHDAVSLPGPTELPAGSLRLALGRRITRGPLLAAVVTGFLRLANGADRLDPGLLAELDERSTVLNAPLAVTGTVRHSTGALETVEALAARGGRIRNDGALELRLDGGETMHLIAGSVRPVE